MKPKRIILIRHGESEGNTKPQIYGVKPDHQLGLTALGRKQAFAAGKALKNLLKDQSVRVYVSPYLRARQTLKEILKTVPAQRVREEPRIREQDWGNLQDLRETDRIDAARRSFGKFFFRFPDGESGADVYDRVTTFLETLHRDFSQPHFAQNALIVTHGLTIRLFIMRWFHESVESFERWKNPRNCQHFILNLGADGRYALAKPMESDKE